MKENPKASSPKVLVGTLQWNRWELTRECVESLMKLNYPHCEIVVLDNASTDGSYEKICGLFPEVRVLRVRQNENLGYGEGVNAQIRLAFEAGVDYLFSVENDSKVDPQALSLMVDAAEADPRAGIVFPSVERADKGFFLVRMEAVKKVGYLDPDYFIYYDEADWFRRIHEAGYKELYIPEAKIWHKGSGTVGAGSTGFHYFKTRNGLRFLKAGGSAGKFVWTNCGTLWGLWDFLRGKRGNRDFGVRPSAFFERQAARIRQGAAAWLRRVRFSIKKATGQSVKIQVFIHWNIGDEVIATPVYEALKRKYPKAVIDAVVRYPEIVQENPFVDSVNRGEAFRPDSVVNLHREIRNEPRTAYLAKFAGAEDWPLPKIYLRDEEISQVRKKWLGQGGSFRIALHTEAGWFAKRWPYENWVRFAEYFAQHYEAEIFVIGTEGRPLPFGRNLMGLTNLRETLALLSQCHLYVGSDSGPLYLAVSVGTPSIGLYGSLDPGLIYPPQPHFIPVWTEVDCRGCWPDHRMKHPDHCPKIVPDCMSSIPVERVIEAAKKLLSLKANQGRVPAGPVPSEF